MVRACPFLPFPYKLSEQLRLGCSQVVTFSAVVGDEVEFPSVRHLVAYCLPVVPADVAVAGMFAEDVFMELMVRVADGRHQALAFDGQDGVAIVIGLWIGSLTDVDAGDHEVGDVADVVPKL